MKVYIAGPMTGLPNYNYDNFNRVARAWREAGYEVENPAENFGGDQSKTYAEYLEAGIKQVLACDAIAVLHGWYESRGAKLEVLIMQMLGRPVYDAETFQLLAKLLPVTTVFGPIVPEKKPALAVPPQPESVVDEARRLVLGDRQNDYGHPIDTYTPVGRMWGAYLGIPDIDPEKVVHMLAVMKLGRESVRHKRDNLVDVIGYEICAELIREEEARRHGEAF